MFFRFGSALILIVATSLLGILVEKQNLMLRRELSRQHYRMDVLQEEHARLRLRSQQLAAVERLFATIEDENSGLVASQPGSIPQSTSSAPHHGRSPGAANSARRTTVNRQSTEHDSSDTELRKDGSPDTDSRDIDPRAPDSSDLTTRRVPLLFWQKPVGDPRLKRNPQ